MFVLLYHLSASLFIVSCALIFPFLLRSIILFAVKICKISGQLWLFSFFSTTSKMHPNLIASFCETLKSSISCVGNGVNNQCKLTAVSALITLAFKYFFSFSLFFSQNTAKVIFPMLKIWSYLLNTHPEVSNIDLFQITLPCSISLFLMTPPIKNIIFRKSSRNYLGWGKVMMSKTSFKGIKHITMHRALLVPSVYSKACNWLSSWIRTPINVILTYPCLIHQISISRLPRALFVLNK